MTYLHIMFEKIFVTYSSGKWIHLAHSPGPPRKKKYLPKNIMIITYKKKIHTKKCFAPFWKNRLHGSFTWSTQKRESSHKKTLMLIPTKRQFSKRKNFSRLFERTDHLAYPKTKFLIKKFALLTLKNSKPNFQVKKFFHTLFKELIFYPKKKNSYTYLKK